MSGFNKILQWLQNEHWLIKSHIPHFNFYVIKGVNKALLWLAFFILKGRLSHPTHSLFFGSDLFEFHWREEPTTRVSWGSGIPKGSPVIAEVLAKTS